MRVRSAIGVIGLVAVLGAAAQAAEADTTHPYLGPLTPGSLTAPEPVGVDDSGNVLVWDNDSHVLAKFTPNGVPVDFSALGSNTIDGSGGLNCPSVPADCDRVPSGGFTDETGDGVSGSQSTGQTAFGTGNMVTVDHSGGPADGYIYVSNRSDVPPGVVEVFDSGGAFKGELNLSIAGPRAAAELQQYGVDVDSNGHVYVYLATPGGGTRGTVDQYAPVDANPADDAFVGQMRLSDDLGIRPVRIMATSAFTYFRAGTCNLPGQCWRKAPASQYFLASETIALSPPPIPFVGFGTQGAAVDDSSGDIYTIDDQLRQWSGDIQQVGPAFGNGHVDIFSADTIAIDESATPTAGSIYVRDGSGIAEFGPPVIIPDVSAQAATVAHTTASLTATIGTAGGGDVTDCQVQYGATSSYGKSAPCSPPPPYSDTADVTANLPGPLDLDGLQVEHDYHYRFNVSNANGANFGPDQTFHTHAVLGVTTGEATDVAPHDAILHGSLDPDNLDTTYHFDYGIDTDYGQVTPSDLVSGSGSVDLTPAPLTNLQAGRTYHYRLVATNSLGTSVGADQTFQTPGPPNITAVRASGVLESSADLNARIDPEGSPTTYRFEYGTTLSYGTSAPVSDASLSTDQSAEDVSAHVGELQPGITYHFRVVAHNQWGATTGDDTTFSFLPPNCPNAVRRQQTGSNYLPDCRAYELVSPGDPSGLQFFASDGLPSLGGLPANEPQNAGISSSPGRFAFYGALGTIPGAKAPNTLIDLYVGTRTQDGWVTKYPGIPGDQALLVAGPHCSATLDLCYDFHFPAQGPSGISQDPTDVGSNVAYLWDSEGNFKGRLPTVSAPNADAYVGDHRASADFSHFFFSSTNVRFYPGGRLFPPGSVYDNNVTKGSISIASLLPNGNAIPQDTGPGSEYLKIPASSSDGSHVLMSTVHGARTHLYMRVGGAVTYDVSGPHAVSFAGMTRDGSEVYFTSAERITVDDHDSSDDLFLWSEATNTVTRVSQGAGNGDADACSTWFETALSGACGIVPITKGAISDNYVAANSGDVFFYSPELLDPDRPGIPNAMNLYVYRDQQMHLVATLDKSLPLTRVQVSPDGRHAAFLTASRLTGYDNAGKVEMYSYDAQSGDLKCVSCLPSGAPPSSDVRASASGLFMADNGRTFFSTRDSLVPQDTDGGIIDVYEFAEGRPQLISSGTGTQDSLGAGAILFPAQSTGLEAVSPDGVDVYFSTFDTLVSQDRNGPFIKFYDARTNGGFAPAVAPLPCAAADECHGPGNAAPGELQIGTDGDLGTAPASGRSSHAQRHHRKSQHKRHHRKPHHRRAAGGGRGGVR